MSVLCSPNRSDIAIHSNSYPNLNKMENVSHATFRGKRKQLDDDAFIITEIGEIRKQMSEMMTLLATLTKNQSESADKICSDIASLKDQVNNINTSMEHITLEQVKIKADIAEVMNTANNTEKKLLNLEADVSTLKTITGKYLPGKCRPIKVCFASQEEALSILRNKNNLKLDSIKIVADQTPKQQSYLKTTGDVPRLGNAHLKNLFGHRPMRRRSSRVPPVETILRRGALAA
ncbi:unnamed protein product [Diatraea saccharalis]|uniref:Uncharacterized protein n=1 Tax=Diatraea saccharalis TaxID=40085 RepID=A0A9N9WGS8_9NEOP|nr:unnamed protein product [Diatraea saccharalis]